MIRSRIDPLTCAEGLLAGNRKFLSRAITLTESSLPADRESARQVLEYCMVHAGKSFRLAVSGAPGCGKSTFIEAFGLKMIESGKKVAVLAIDPSSTLTGGSILGDKTRMAELSMHPNAFIRPSPSGEMYGGINRVTRESILLCEAAGFDLIIVETVGVGQSEVIAETMTDFFMVLMLAGAGDDIQGIKRGIIERADSLIFTKADGDAQPKVRAAAGEFRRALELFPHKDNGWRPQVLTCSSVTKSGFEEIFELLNRFQSFTCENGAFLLRRKNQNIDWFFHALDSELKDAFYRRTDVQNALREWLPKIKNEEIIPYRAVEHLLNVFLQSSNPSVSSAWNPTSGTTF